MIHLALRIKDQTWAFYILIDVILAQMNEGGEHIKCFFYDYIFALAHIVFLVFPSCGNHMVWYGAILYCFLNCLVYLVIIDNEENWRVCLKGNSHQSSPNVKRLTGDLDLQAKNCVCPDKTRLFFLSFKSKELYSLKKKLRKIFITQL